MPSPGDDLDRLLLDALHAWMRMLHACLPEEMPVRERRELGRLRDRACRARNGQDFVSVVERYFRALDAPECQVRLDGEYRRNVDRAFGRMERILEEVRRELSEE